MDEDEVGVVVVPAYEAAVAVGCTAEHPAEESAAGKGKLAAGLVYGYETAVGAVAIDAAGDVDAAVAVDDFSAVDITYVRQIINGDAGTEFRRGGNAAGNGQVLDGGTLEVAEGRTAVFTIGFEVDVKRSAVAVERAVEGRMDRFAIIGILLGCGNHLGDRFVAVVEVISKLVILVSHMVHVFMDIFSEDIPVVGIGDDVGVRLRAVAREGLINLKAGGLLAGV